MGKFTLQVFWGRKSARIMLSYLLRALFVQSSLLSFLGGFNGQECMNSAEFYDPTTNTWSPLPNMISRRSGVSCVAHKGYIYVVGGFNGLSRMNTGERFDPETQTWSSIREMYHPRSNFGLEIIDDMIFAIGGFNGVATIAHAECYVVETDEW